MPSRRRRITFLFPVLLFPAALASLLLPLPASAQCDPSGGTLAILGFQNVSIEPDKPFQAEYLVDGFLHNFSGMGLILATHPQSVARDSQGRIRAEGTAGKYDVQSPNGEKTEVERHLIWICDPVTQNLIRLDTVDKTATIQVPPPPSSNHLPVHAPSAGQSIDSQKSYCSRVFSSRKALRNAQTEDLGHQIILGYDAVGQREWHVPLVRSGEAAKPPTSYSDWWCSDDLGAIMARIDTIPFGIGTHKNEVSMKKIERREPDPSLFQIPPDYTILEPAQPVRGVLLPRPVPKP